MTRAHALPRSAATFVPHGRSTPRPRSSEPPEALPATPRAKPPKHPSDPSRAPERTRSRGRARGQRVFLYHFSSCPLSLSALTGVSQRAFLYYFARRPLARSAALLSSRAPPPWIAAAPSLDRSSGTALAPARPASSALAPAAERGALRLSGQYRARTSPSSPPQPPLPQSEALSSGGLRRIWSVSLFCLPLQSKQSWCGSSAG